jgi:hypothetical protein
MAPCRRQLRNDFGAIQIREFALGEASRDGAVCWDLELRPDPGLPPKS